MGITDDFNDFLGIYSQVFIVKACYHCFRSKNYRALSEHLECNAWLELFYSFAIEIKVREIRAVRNKRRR
jgi:hypothetical protein